MGHRDAVASFGSPSLALLKRRARHHGAERYALWDRPGPGTRMVCLRTEPTFCVPCRVGIGPSGIVPLCPVFLFYAVAAEVGPTIPLCLICRPKAITFLHSKHLFASR
jgi:hypothetical protein